MGGGAGCSVYFIRFSPVLVTHFVMFPSGDNYAMKV